MTDISYSITKKKEISVESTNEKIKISQGKLTTPNMTTESNRDIKACMKDTG